MMKRVSPTPLDQNDEKRLKLLSELPKVPDFFALFNVSHEVPPLENDFSRDVVELTEHNLIQPNNYIVSEFITPDSMLNEAFFKVFMMFSNLLSLDSFKPIYYFYTLLHFLHSPEIERLYVILKIGGHWPRKIDKLPIRLHFHQVRSDYWDNYMMSLINTESVAAQLNSRHFNIYRVVTSCEYFLESIQRVFQEKGSLSIKATWKKEKMKRSFEACTQLSFTQVDRLLTDVFECKREITACMGKTDYPLQYRKQLFIEILKIGHQLDNCIRMFVNKL